MAGRESLLRAEPGFSLPAFERLAPPPPPELVAARIEAHSAPGDVVVDLHGRGGWVARAAVDRQRRAVTRVEPADPAPRRGRPPAAGRPPPGRGVPGDRRGPREQSSLKVSIGEKFATRCATCGRSVVVDEFIWEAARTPTEASGEADGARRPMPAGAVPKHYRCTVCRDQVGGGDQRHGAVDDDDVARPARRPRARTSRADRLRDRFPTSTATRRSSTRSSTCTRHASSWASTRSSSGSRATCAPPRSRRRCGSRSSTRCCRRAGSTASRAGSRPSGSRAAGSACPPASSGASATRGSRSRTATRLVRGFVQRLEGGRARLGPAPASARTSRASPRGWRTSSSVAGPSAARPSACPPTLAESR